jgi:hypothetical protein
MNQLKLNLDKDTYQQLRIKFNDDIKAMENFAKKIITNEIKKSNMGLGKEEKKNNEESLENYLKSSKTGSRSYGIKGQGW